ncbi:PQQ enzyme repeat protein [Acetobacteraceae bacterium AT-5844]|nr:PQQ enzyme repeat protein [Acetobacteraceae bacterium AT-5844]
MGQPGQGALPGCGAASSRETLTRIAAGSAPAPNDRMEPSMQPTITLPGFSRRSALGLFAGLLAAGRISPAMAAAVEKSVRLVPPGGLYEVVVSSTTGLVHVAAAGQRGGGGAAILGLDPQTLEVKSRIALEDPAFGLAVNDPTGTLYTTNTRTGSVSAIDLKSGQVTKHFAHGEKAHVRQLVVDEEANRIYVSVVGVRGAESSVWVIDGAKGEIAQVISAGLGEGMTGLTLDRAGNRLFATRMQANDVIEIDLGSGTVKRSFASGGETPINAAYDAAGKRLFVTNQKSNTLTVIDAASGQLVKSIETGEGALGVTLHPTNGTILVANRRAGTVSIVDGSKLELQASLATGSHPNTIAVDRRTGAAYVTNKARSAGRGQPPIDDPNGDTVSMIRF